jgi:D-Tyr-tRNA(Tyr) deacylase
MVCIKHCMACSVLRDYCIYNLLVTVTATAPLSLSHLPPPAALLSFSHPCICLLSSFIVHCLLQRALLQRVSSAKVVVDGKTVSEIGRGIVALIGIERKDNEKDAEHMYVESLSMMVDRRSISFVMS